MNIEESDTNENGTDNDDEEFDINKYREDIDSDDSYETLEENEDNYDDDEYTGPILPGGHRFDRKLLSIRYPGIVENPEKAIETLGGLGAISAASDTPNRRLELRFRPKDGYRKPTCGDRHKTAGFFIRIRVKKSRLRQMEQAENMKGEELDSKEPYDLAKLEQLFGSLGKKIRSDDSAKEKNKGGKMVDESGINEVSGKKGKSCSRGEDMENHSSINQFGTEPNILEREILFFKMSEKSGVRNEKNLTVDEMKNSHEDFSKDEDYQVPTAKVIGRVETEFDFQNLCDFQYVAIGKSVADPKIEEYIYESVHPVEIPPYSWLKKKVPYFLPPPAFSRMDSVQQFSLKLESDKGPKDVIGKTRKCRAGFSNFINFNTPITPSEPPAGIETAMRIKFLQKSHLERMQKLFEERPVWSRSALTCVTKFTGEQLKFLLPSVAYYFMTGPWRVMWVKLGYDPRKDPQARIYQTLDYRLRAMYGLEYTVNRKRTSSEYTLPYKSAPGTKPRPMILSGMQEESAGQKKEQLLDEATHIYREGVVPSSRQIFYQYCDIHVPEIQEMLRKLPDHLPSGSKCHEKRGWLPSGFSDQCREIINRQVRSVLRKQMNIPEDPNQTALLPKRLAKTNLRLKKPRNRTRKRPKKPEVQEAKSGNCAETAENTEPPSSQTT